MHEFEGKTAVVTGGASGIGRSLAERFGCAGMNVVVADIEEDALDRVVAELEQAGTRAVGVVTDTMKRDSVRDLADRTRATFGNVHILCNNAGVSAPPGVAVWEIPDEDWDWIMGVNFWGVLYGLQVFVPGMLSHGENGHIVNTASMASFWPLGGPYGVSKHGVLALTEQLYFDLKMRGSSVGASVLCPGFVNTQIPNAERNRPRELGSYQLDPDEAATVAAILAQGKQPAEVAESVFESIRNERFYILPSPAWEGIVRERVERVLKQDVPVALDFDDIISRREAGEDF